MAHQERKRFLQSDAKRPSEVSKVKKRKIGGEDSYSRNRSGSERANRRPSGPEKFRKKAAPASKKQAQIVKHPKFEGVFATKGKKDALLTRNMIPGISVYGEKRVVVEEDSVGKIEYRNWNPFRSKLAAGIVCGLDKTYISPGKKILYLGAASGTSVSHVSDILGPNGVVYAVEFSARSGRDLLSLAKRRQNIVPIIEDARHPQRYSILVPMVDTIFSDVAQPDQARILTHNARYFLKDNGGVVISIKANCINSLLSPAEVFASEVDKLKKEGVRPEEQVTLEPYERDHAIVVGIYRKTKK